MGGANKEQNVLMGGLVMRKYSYKRQCREWSSTIIRKSGLFMQIMLERKDLVDN